MAVEKRERPAECVYVSAKLTTCAFHLFRAFFFRFARRSFQSSALHSAETKAAEQVAKSAPVALAMRTISRRNVHFRRETDTEKGTNRVN